MKKNNKIPSVKISSDESSSELTLANMYLSPLIRPIPRNPTTQITIDIEPPTPEERSPNRPKDLIIPQLVIEHPSPTKERVPAKFLGSPPPQRACIVDLSVTANEQQSQEQQPKM